MEFRVQKIVAGIQAAVRHEKRLAPIPGGMKSDGPPQIPRALQRDAGKNSKLSNLNQAKQCFAVVAGVRQRE